MRLDAEPARATETGPAGEIGERPMSPVLRAGALAALWIGLVLVMLQPTPHRLSETLPNDLGDPNFVTWTLGWGARTLVTDPLDAFDAPIYWPEDQALAFSDSLLTFAPAFGALELASGSPVVALNLLSFALYVFSLTATYLLGRWLFGRTGPAVLMAVVFTFTSYSVGQQSHVQNLTFGLFPLGILLLLRYLERGRWRDAIALAAVTVAFVYGAVYYALLWFLVAPAVALVVLLVGPRPSRPAVLRGVAAAAVAGLACLPAAVSYHQVSEEHGLARDYAAIDPLLLTDLITPAANNWLWNDTLDPFNSTGTPGDHGSMMSVTAYLLAAGGIVLVVVRRDRPSFRGDDRGPVPDTRRLDRRGALWGILLAGAGSFVVGLGPTIGGVPAPYRLLHRFVPGFDGIRVSSRLAVVGFLAVAVLAALAAAALADRVARRDARAARAAPGAVLAVLGLVAMSEVLVVGRARAEAWDSAEVAAVYEALDERAEGVVLELPIRGPLDGFAWPFVEAPRMPLALIDGNARINGYSGHWPSGFVERTQILQQYPSVAAADLVDELGVRYVVVHTESPWSGAEIDPAWVDQVLAALPEEAQVSRHGAAWLVDLGRSAQVPDP